MFLFSLAGFSLLRVVYLQFIKHPIPPVAENTPKLELEPTGNADSPSTHHSDDVETEEDPEDPKFAELYPLFQKFLKKEQIPGRLNSLASSLELVYSDIVGPIYTSLLTKGMASLLFCHQPGFYNQNIRLTVEQMGTLNDELERRRRRGPNLVALGQDIVDQNPGGPIQVVRRGYETQPFEDAYPGITSSHFVDFHGNVPQKDESDSSLISVATIDVLGKKVSATIILLLSQRKSY